MEALTPFEVRVVVARLLGTRPHLRVLAAVADHEDLWRACRSELQGVDLRIDGWDIRPRWFGVVVLATPRQGRIAGPSTIPWRVVADELRLR